MTTKSVLMYGKGWATMLGYVLMAVGFVASGFGFEVVGKPMQEIGLAVGGYGTVRKKIAGL